MVEVIKHGPRDLPDAEWRILVVLCESARDETRLCWPGFDEIHDGTDKAESTIRRLLTNLERRKLIKRLTARQIQPGAMPVVAYRGHRTVYEILPMPGRDETMPLTSGPLSREKGAQIRAERGPVPSSKGPTSGPPSPQVPSGPLTGPAAIDDRAIAAVRRGLLARTGREVDDAWAVRVAAQLLAGRADVRHPARWLAACLETEPNPARLLPTPTP